MSSSMESGRKAFERRRATASELSADRVESDQPSNVDRGRLGRRANRGNREARDYLEQRREPHDA